MLKQLVKAYASEKQYWLECFQQNKHLKKIKQSREVRDKAIKAHYQSSYGLQARMWKLALQDAADTMDKYWQSLLDKVKGNIYKHMVLFHHRLSNPSR